MQLRFAVVTYEKTLLLSFLLFSISVKTSLFHIVGEQGEKVNHTVLGIHRAGGWMRQSTFTQVLLK